jgi:hypothetical protein
MIRYLHLLTNIFYQTQLGRLKSRRQGSRSSLVATPRDGQIILLDA